MDNEFITEQWPVQDADMLTGDLAMEESWDEAVLGIQPPGNRDVERKITAFVHV